MPGCPPVVRVFGPGVALYLVRRVDTYSPSSSDVRAKNRTAYLTASTYLSSRAFPSTLLSAHPTLVAASTSHPVLLPGIDALNHKRGQAVSWIVDGAGENWHDMSISLVVHVSTPEGEEVFNNYG
jgi:hypothetical protein